MAISHCYWHLVVKFGRWTFFSQWHTRAEMPWIPVHKTWQMNLLLADGTPNVAEQRCLHTATDISVVKNGNFTLLLTSSGQDGNFTLLLTSSGQEWQISHCYRWIYWSKFGNEQNLAEPLWLLEPLVPEQRCLAYQYTQLGRWTYFGQWTPHQR